MCQVQFISIAYQDRLRCKFSLADVAARTCSMSEFTPFNSLASDSLTPYPHQLPTHQLPGTGYRVLLWMRVCGMGDLAVLRLPHLFFNACLLCSVSTDPGCSFSSSRSMSASIDVSQVVSGPEACCINHNYQMFASIQDRARSGCLYSCMQIFVCSLQSIPLKGPSAH